MFCNGLDATRMLAPLVGERYRIDRSTQVGAGSCKTRSQFLHGGVARFIAPFASALLNPARSP
jgi:hypothetical protein